MLKVEVDGFFEDVERRMILFNNLYDNLFFMKLIKIENNFKFLNFIYKDFLGGILLLGIERNKIGDLLVDNNICYVLVYEEIESFIIYNLDKIGRVVCKVEVVENNIFFFKVIFKEEVILVFFLRIDGIVFKIVNILRLKL